ncbi:MAG: glycosyltransferase [Oligoflexus sp.]
MSFSSQSPIVVWDAYAIGQGYSGIAQHAKLLGSELLKIGISPLLLNPRQDSNGRFLSFSGSALVRPDHLRDQFANNKVLRAHALNNDERWLASLMKHQLSSTGPSIVHGLSNFNIPTNRKRTAIKRVVTVHDLIPLLAKGKVSKAQSLQMAYLLPKAIKAADQVIAVSQWTADTLQQFFPGVAPRLIIIPNGFVPQTNGARPTSVSRETQEKGLHFLSVSRFEAYKRFDRLVEVIKSCPNTIKVTVVTDSKGATYLQAHAQDLLASSRLEIKTQIIPQDLDKLYLSVDALLHFSEYEGFCLPAAEAISQGIPVIFQKGSGIDEVVGPCGVGMEKTASNADWAELLASQDWRVPVAQLNDWLEQQMPWSQVARRTRAVYTSL